MVQSIRAATDKIKHGGWLVIVSTVSSLGESIDLIWKGWVHFRRPPTSLMNKLFTLFQGFERFVLPNTTCWLNLRSHSFITQYNSGADLISSPIFHLYIKVVITFNTWFSCGISMSSIIISAWGRRAKQGPNCCLPATSSCHQREQKEEWGVSVK